MKKVLIIQYFYKPIISNQSFRYDRIIENCGDNVEIDILTSHHYGLKQYERQGNITVYRVNHRLLKKIISLEEANVFKLTEEKPFMLNQIIRNIVKKIMWPDFAFLWILPAFIQGKKLLAEKQYDMVFTVSFPFSSHLIGYFLKRKYRRIPWTIDYIDPFSIIGPDENPANNVRIYKRLNIWIEKLVNSFADKIFMLDEAYNRFTEFFPEFNDKITVVPPMLGIEEQKYQLVAPKKFRNTGINIVYIGTFYKNIRSPEKFFLLYEKLLRHDNKIYLHIVGDIGDCSYIVSEYARSYPDNIFVYGKVSREEAMMFLKGSDILLNIANNSQAQLPGKVVEYLYSKKKIINYTNDLNNNSSVFFRKYAKKNQVLEVNDNGCCIDNILQFIYADKHIEHIEFRNFLPENISKIYFK